MFEKGFTGFFYKFSVWFTKIAYTNVLWVIFSLLGFVIFTVFPATIALFAVIRLLLIKEDDIPIFKTFWQSFKKEFFKANGIGWGILITLMIFFSYMQVFEASEHQIIQLLYYPTMISAMIFCLTVLYFLPSYVHYNQKLLPTFKNSFLVMVYNPLNTFTIASSVFVVGLVSILFPILILFFSVSFLVLFIMMAALRSYKRVEDKKGVTGSSARIKPQVQGNN